MVIAGPAWMVEYPNSRPQTTQHYPRTDPLQFHTSLAEPYGTPCPGDAAFAVTYPAERVVCAADAAAALTAGQVGAGGAEGRRDIGDIDADSLKWDHRYRPAGDTAGATAGATAMGEGAGGDVDEGERPKVGWPAWRRPATHVQAHQPPRFPTRWWCTGCPGRRRFVPFMRRPR